MMPMNIVLYTDNLGKHQHTAPMAIASVHQNALILINNNLIRMKSASCRMLRKQE